MPNPTTDERFAAKYSIDENGCWIWTAAKDGHGYGQFCTGGRRSKTAAHRWSYERHVGPIPAGLDLDHLCRVPACVNPEHLEPVTRAENTRRGAVTLRVGDRCRGAGHLIATASDIAIRGGYNRCRACLSAKDTAHRSRVREAVARGDREPRHGTLLGYAADLCRCDECRAFMRTYHAELKRRKAAA